MPILLRSVPHIGRCLAILCALLWGSMIAPLASAMSDLPSPEEVLERAKMNRFEYSDVIHELKAGVEKLETLDDMKPYLLLLDPLVTIETELNFARFDVSPLKEYGELLTRAAIEKMDLRTASSKLVQAFVKWSDDDVKVQFARTQATVVNSIEDKATLVEINKKVGAAITTLEHGERGLLPKRYIIEEYEALVGKVIARYLQLSDASLNLEELRTMIDEIRYPATLVDLMDITHRQALNPDRKISLGELLDVTIAVQNKIRSFKESVRREILERPGSIISDILIESMYSRGQIKPQIVDRAFEGLDIFQVVAVAAKIRNLAWDQVRVEEVTFLARLSEKLQEKLIDLGRSAEAKDLTDLVNRARLADQLQRRKLDGYFTVTAGDKSGIMTIGSWGLGEVVIGLGTKYLSYGFAHGLYNPKRRTLEVYSYQTTERFREGSLVNRFVVLNFDARGDTFRGILHDGTYNLVVEGKRQGRYDEYLLQPSLEKDLSPSVIEGNYIGNALNRDVKLTIKRHGTAYTGHLTFSPSKERINISFDMVYFNTSNGALYMTSRNGGRDTFLQIRGIYRNGVIEGLYIIGDRLGSYRFIVKKVSEW